jgi:murein L,D-transpeptidase YcbB/YkuD
MVLLIGLGSAGCGSVKAASPETLKPRVTGLGSKPSVQGERLQHSRAVAAFYEKRNYEAAWRNRSTQEKVVEAIRGAQKHGLTPADYHLEAIEGLLAKEGGSPEALADLDILLTDAVAAMVDHLRYGRVRPVSLDPRWNIDPRDDAPPIDSLVARVAASGSPERTIESAKPNHFIYDGLIEALARLREIASQGGWATVPAGKSIKPGAQDRRIPAVRARLAVTGEVSSPRADDSLRYDPQLVEAVKLFQQRHRLEPDGIIDKATVEAMNVSAATRVDQVRVNLERARWVLPGLENDFLLVNLPAFKAYLIRDGQNVWETRTQVGEEARQTPAFRSNIKTVVFNPDWTVPPTILEEDVLEGMRRGENMIAKKRLTILDAEGNTVSPASIDWGSASAENFPYTLRQPPGEDNALGRVKFLFPNRFSIYLHDTPHRTLFEAERRTFSSGCIRVEHALELANRLLGDDGWSPQRVQQAVADGKTQNVNLDDPLPILIVYWTVSVGRSGEVRYMRDIYGHDRAVLAALDRPAASRVANRNGRGGR